MRYLKKLDNSEIIKENLSYAIRSDRSSIRNILLTEQNKYCAYSECYIKDIDSCHIEHFDPRLKNTAQDDYYNWYAVLGWINEHKPKKIEQYLEILSPKSENIAERIHYKNGLYEPVIENDKEAINLIKFLLLNKNELVSERQKHIHRLKWLKNELKEKKFKEKLKSFPEQLSFATAIESEFGIILDEYLK